MLCPGHSTWHLFGCGMQTLSRGKWDLVPWPGIGLRPPALRVRSPSHWPMSKVLPFASWAFLEFFVLDQVSFFHVPPTQNLVLFSITTYHLPTKVCVVKAMVFSVVMYGCEGWTIKKAESRIDAFELWCWRRPLRVPWTARRSNQSTLMKINPESSLEGLMLKLKL